MPDTQSAGAREVPAPPLPWHHRDVYFVLLTTAIAILVGVVVVAMGGGGEIARFRRDLPMRPPQIRDASDLPRLRLPIGLFGYQEQATREALDAAARLLAEQEAEIARLRAALTRQDADASGQDEPGYRQPGLTPGDPVVPGSVASQAWPQP